MRVLVAAMATIVLLGGIARAEEDDRALSVSLGYATFSVPDHDPEGGAVGVEYQRGLSESLSLRAAGGVGAYQEDGYAYSGHATVGFTYMFDVLKYVPYANVGVGGIIVGGKQVDLDVAPVVEMALGLDILQSRDFSYGVQLQLDTFATEATLLTVGARATWRWGYF